MARVSVLSPVGERRRTSVDVPALPEDLHGLRIGFLDNTKTNFDRLVSEMGTILTARFGVAAVVHRRKANASTPAAPEIVASLVKDCDLVFAGSGD
jgi:hypothetical protein